MTKTPLGISALLILLIAGASENRLQCAESGDLDFATHISPILRAYCVGCHNPDDYEGGLDLSTYESIQAGVTELEILAAGNAAESKIVQVLTGESETVMPPEGNEPPKPEEIALLRAWIDAGAAGPDVPSNTPLPKVPQIVPTKPVRPDIGDMEYSPDGKLLAISRYGHVELIDAEMRTTVQALRGHQGKVNAVAFSSDGKMLAAVAGEPGLFGELKIWNVEDGKESQSIRGHVDSIYAVAFSPDGTAVATGSYDQEIKLWSVKDGHEIRTLSGHNGPIFDLAFHPAGRILASASGDATAKLWDANTGARLDTFGEPLKEVYTVAFNTSGRQLAAAGVDNRIRIWRISDTGEEGTNSLLLSRFAHDAAIVRINYSPDGKSIVSAAEDQTVRVWESDPLKERFTLDEQSDWAVALAFRNDSQSFAVGRLDGTYSVHRADDGRRIPAKPVLLAISNYGIQRGRETMLTLSGRNLGEIDGVSFNREGMTARIISASDDGNQASIAVDVSSNVARGKSQVWVSAEGVNSEKLSLYVDDIPQVEEQEPNSNLALAADISLPASCWGTLGQPGDVDFYRFRAQAGQTLVFDAATDRIGGKGNLVVTLYDGSGRTLDSNNDFDGDRDPLLGFVVLEDGEYIIKVSDLQIAGSAEHRYRLSIGEFPYVTGMFPPGVSTSRESQIKLLGFNLPEDASLFVHPQKPGEIDLPIPDRFRSRRDFQVMAYDGDEGNEAEPNDLPRSATEIAIPGAYNGQIFAEGGADTDCFRITARAGDPWIIETQAAELGSPLDTRIEVLDDKGHPVPRLVLKALRDSSTTFRPSSSTQAGFRVTNWEEMHLDQFLYLGGEVIRIFRQPQGPDSDTLFYTLGGQRRAYFDTTPVAHALDELIYIVEPRAVGEPLEQNGLPEFPVYFENDDDSYRKKGRDSRLTFIAPKDGTYIIRVTDVRDFFGERFVYRLIIREPRPDFSVNLAGKNLTVHRGSGRRFTVNAERMDEFDDPIQIDISNVPPGFTVSTPLVIQGGHQSAQGVIFAAADAQEPAAAAWENVKVEARAIVGGEEVSKSGSNFGHITLGDQPKVQVALAPADLTIVPGSTTTAKLSVQRHDFEDRIQFDVGNLPHGVIVDNIGLNGVLIPEGQSERTIYFTAEHWVPETTRTLQATAEVDGGLASPPITLHVLPPSGLARAGD